jgi:hypothetical protein
MAFGTAVGLGHYGEILRYDLWCLVLRWDLNIIGRV